MRSGEYGEILPQLRQSGTPGRDMDLCLRLGERGGILSQLRQQERLRAYIGIGKSGVSGMHRAWMLFDRQELIVFGGDPI